MIGEPTVVGQTIAGTGSSALPRKLWTDQEPTSSAYSYLFSFSPHLTTDGEDENVEKP